MNAMRSALAVVLFMGCTKTATPPPQPPATDDEAEAPEPEPKEPEAKEDVPDISEAVDIQGPIKEEQVQAVVQEHFTEIQDCFNAALVRMESSTNVNGAIAVRIEIDGSGKVTSAEVEADSLGDDQAPACITEKVKAWRFPKPSKGSNPSSVLYPFFLRSY